MTDEEYFRKNYPDSCYSDKPLSPHWDFFQDGVEFGERESEEKIKELEESLGKLQKSTFNMIDEKNNRIADLEKELKKWKDGTALKDEEIGCIETDFNTFKSKAKELLRFWVNDFFDGFNNSNRYEERRKALEQSEQFLKENE